MREKIGRRKSAPGTEHLHSEYDHTPTYVARTVRNTRAQYTLRYQNLTCHMQGRRDRESGQVFTSKTICNNFKNKFTCEQ